MVQKSGTRINMGSRKRKEKMHENLSTKSLLSINQPQQQHTQKRFMGVRQSQSGRWVAEIKGTAQKIRLWLGTFDTPEEAAHAYDEAACLLRGADTRTNFWPRTTGGFGEPTGRSCSSSVLSAKVLNQLLDHLKTQRAAKSPQSSLSLPSKPSLLSPPQHQHQHQHQQHNHKQELELITCDVSTCGATTHCVDEKYCRGNDYNIHDEMKNKVEVERDVSLDMDLKLEDFSYFFAPFETEGKRRVEIGTYEYWSMLFAAAKGV